MEYSKSFKLDESKKMNLVQSIIRLELKAFSLLNDKKFHPRYKQIIAYTNKEELMKKDIQSLLRRRESLNQRDSLSMDDIKKIFKDQGIEAVAAFNWTDLVYNEAAFWILEEIKNQLKERNEPKQSTSASIDQNPSTLKELRIMMLGQGKMMDNFYQFDLKMNNMEKTMSTMTQKMNIMEEKMNNINKTIQ